MNGIRRAIVDQFGNPRGVLGAIAGLIMTLRPSNRARNARTLALLDIRPNDRVLEVGFGPGVAAGHAAALARRGKVVGIDRSPLMLRQATRRNARAIAAGRLELVLGDVDRPPALATRFDKVFAVNVYAFWSDPVAVLRGLRAMMSPGGTIALTFQPRRRGATAHDTRRGAERMASSLREAGFAEVRVVLLPMAPVDAACVLGREATAGRDEAGPDVKAAPRPAGSNGPRA